MSPLPLRTTLPKPTTRLRLGDAYDVSPFCLGQVREAHAISAAFEAGINFFFVTADMHWLHYEETRRGLADLLSRGKGIRDQIVVAGVSYVAQPEFCYYPFKEILESLPALGHLDVTIAGAARAHDFATRKREYERHSDFGVRAFGATFHDRAFAAETIAAREVQVGFVRYNPSHRGAETEIFPRIQGCAPTLVYNFSTTGGRLLKREFEELGIPDTYWRPGATEYYRYALVRPELDGMLCAPGTQAQVRDMVDALGRGPLTEEEYTYLVDLADLAKGDARLTDPANP